jgi:hypothetical protein
MVDSLSLGLDIQTDSDAARALSTYRNYLLALRGFVDVSYRGPRGRFRRLAEEQTQIPKFQALQPAGRYDLEAIRSVLFNAWHTEAVLALPGALPDAGLIRFTNQWAPVQAYYAVYSLMRAWFLTEGNTTSSHSQALRSMSSVVAYRGVFPAPWSFACSGGHTLGDAVHTGFPSGRIYDVNALTTPPGTYSYDDWSSKILRTTRKFFLEQAEQKWKAGHRTKRGAHYKRIPSAERQRIASRVHPTTVFDFVYRLRIRSNYRDVDDFVSGQLSDSDAQAYFQSLLFFTRATMQVLETLIRVRMKSGEFDQFAAEFLRPSRRATYSFLKNRLEAIQSTLP